MRRLVAGALLLFSARNLSAEGEAADGVRTAWEFRRTVKVSSADPALAAISLPPDLLAKSAPDLRDLRLVDAEGRDVPILPKHLVASVATASWTGQLVDARSEKDNRSTWTIDLQQEVTFDTISLEIAETGFAKGIRVEASDDRATWRLIRDDAGVFDRVWNVRIHHTIVACPSAVSARFLRLTADDRRSPPISVQGVTVSRVRPLGAERWSLPATLRPLPRPDRHSAWHLDIPAGLPLEQVEILSTTPVFGRTVTLKEVREVNGARTEKTVGSGLVYRLRLSDALVSGEQRTLRLSSAPEGALTLDIEDGDSPPLENVRAVVSGAAVRLVFPSAPGPFFLYYANPLTRGPLYDLSALEPRISATEDFAPTQLGPEIANTRYRPTPPLPFAFTRGAHLDGRDWSHRRPLQLVSTDEIVTAVLGVEDLALLRPDLGDVRVVDAEDRQIPYILEPHATLERVPLSVETKSGHRSTRHRLLARGTDGRPLKVTLQSVELSFAETFFSRPARLSVPSAGGGEDQVLLSTTLARHPGAPETIVLGVSSAPSAEWDLDIDEGDNAPLAAPSASGFASVPRIVFKADAGAYALLLGDERAASPQYDIASLREEVLAYSATVVTPGALSPNHKFRRRLADYVAEGPSVLGLWLVLLGGVAILLVLTVRIVRASSNG